MSGKSKDGSIYVMWCEGFVKIGISNQTNWRLTTLQIGNPFKIHLLGHIKALDAIREETILHGKYAQYRIRGEWFKLPEKELSELLWNVDPDRYPQPEHLKPKPQPEEIPDYILYPI